MSVYRRDPAQLARAGASARFTDRAAANRATRALQKELGLRPEQVSVALEPGIDPVERGGAGGYLGITKAGAILVHARVQNAAAIDRVREVLGRFGGAIVESDRGSVSTGGYGPTTAHGTRGVFGGPPNTSAMANHLYTHAPEPSESEKPAE